jgi:glucose-6-phosphate 1-dehydrogenase
MEKPQNLILVIFGATGDLTHRKLMPALYALYDQDMLPGNFYVLGVGRKEWSEEDFREKMTDGIRRFSEKTHLDHNRVNEFIKFTSYMAIEMDSVAGYFALTNRLQEIDSQHGTEGNYLFYLSMPPRCLPPLRANWVKVASAIQKILFAG